MEIEIDYTPRDWTIPLHEGKERFKVLVIHRRAGKTTSTLNHLQRDALLNAKSRYAFIAPTYRMAKDIAWDMLKNFARPIPGVTFNESELRVDYPNGSRIRLYGAENVDRLRGLALWGVIFDEYSQQPSNIFSEIVLPALSDHKGYAIFIGTPKGKNEFYNLYEHAQDPKNTDWLGLLLSVDDTNLVSDEELATQKSIQDPDEHEQEWYCSFEAAIKGAYYADQIREARDENRISFVPHDKGLDVHTWWDLGMSDSTTIGFFQKAGMEWRMIDYYESSGEGLDHYAAILQAKPYIYGHHWAPHDIEVRELGTGQSRLEVARKLGINFRIAPNLHVQEGITAVRRRFHTLFIDEKKCSQFINAVALYRKEWDEKRGEFKPHPFHDWTSHAADMLRYWAVCNFNDKKAEPIVPVWNGYNKR